MRTARRAVLLLLAMLALSCAWLALGLAPLGRMVEAPQFLVVRHAEKRGALRRALGKKGKEALYLKWPIGQA